MYRLQGSQNSIIIFLWYLWELLPGSYHSYIYIHLTAAISILWVSQKNKFLDAVSCQPAITSRITPTSVPISPVHQMLHTYGSIIYMMHTIRLHGQLTLLSTTLWDFDSKHQEAQLLLAIYSYISSQDIGLCITIQSQSSSQKYHCTDILDLAGVATS